MSNTNAEVARLSRIAINDLGVTAGPSKVARLVKDYVRTHPPVPFEVWIVNAARPALDPRVARTTEQLMTRVKAPEVVDPR